MGSQRVGHKLATEQQRKYWVLLLPEAFIFTSVLAEGCMHTQGRFPGWVRYGKRNQIIGLEEDKNPEELTHINNLTASLVNSYSLGPSSFSQGVHLCLASISSIQTISPCVLPLVLSKSVNISSLIRNCILSFTVSASVIKAFSTGDKGPGKNSFEPLALACLVVGIPGSHPGHQVQFLSREWRSCFMSPLTAASPRSELQHYSLGPPRGS